MCRVAPHLLEQQRSFDRLRLFAESGDRWSAELQSFPSRSGRMFFYVQVGAVTALALYDPGAEVTLMRTSLFNEVKKEAKGPINPAPVNLSQACGAPVKDVKQTHFRLNIGGQVALSSVFICPSTAHDMIIGMPDINRFRISYDAEYRRLVHPGQGLLKVRTAKVIKGGEMASVDCQIFQANPLDCGLGSSFTIGSEGMPLDEDLYVPPLLVTGYRPGDVISVPIKNMSVCDIDLKSLPPDMGIGVTQEAKNAIPLTAFKIGDLPMPPETECPPEKKKYLLENLKVGPALPEHLKKQFNELIVRKHQAFGAHEFDLGHTDSYVHQIKLTDHTPVFNKQFQLSEHAQRFLKEHIRELVRIGVLENSQSAWNSCCFVVPKPSGSYRMVIDLRSVNAKTIPAIHNGVTVDDLIKRVGSLFKESDHGVLSSCDILKGFWQVPLDPASREYTSFNIPTIGSFRYTVAPMGASGSVYAFWTLMSAVTHGLSNTLCYLDDLITGSSTPEQHLVHLERLFDRMIMHKLTLGLPKCTFFQEKVDFLGFEVSGKGMKPGTPKTEVIKLMTPPKTLKELRGFVGLTNYFGHHFPFQREAKFLSSLTRKGSGWTKGPLPERAQLAFDRIKIILGTQPLLRYPNYLREFLLFTDAATGKADKSVENKIGGLGAFLAQQNERGNLYPLGYAGRGLKPHEENYSAFLLELAAALYGLDEFRHIIDGFPTRLFTDHQPLQAFANPLSKVHDKTLSRLQEAVIMKPVTIQYHPGLLNGVADTLSRIEYRRSAGLPDEEHPIICALEESREFNANLIEAVQMFVPVWQHTAHDLRMMQEKDDFLSKVINHVNRSARSNEPSVLQAAKMSLINDQGLLFQRKPGRFKWGRYLLQAPDCLKADILWHGHDSRMGGGHTGIERTYDRIASLFIWEDMMQDITEYVQSCHTCQTKGDKNKPTPSEIREMPIERLIGGRVHIDTYGEIPVDENGNKYILVFICAFSRYAKMVAVPSKDAVTVAKAFRDAWVCTFGVPLVVVSDNGTEFLNEVMGAFLNMMGTEHRTTSAVHPQPNGKVERVNATVRNFLQSYVDWSKDNWSDCLATLNFAYNTSIHIGLKLSPFEVVFNYQPRFPGFETMAGINDKFYGEEKADLIPQQIKLVREFVASQSKLFQTQWCTRMNKLRKDPVYKRGDLVLFFDPQMAGRRQKVRSRKFVNPWLGPCKVVDFRPGTNSIKIKLLNESKVHPVHVDRVKPYISRDTGRWIRGPGLEPGEGLPEAKGGDEEVLQTLSEELRETQRELDYDEDTYIDEGMEFLDRPAFTNEGDMVNWPASRGHPIPRVEVTDPGMDPGQAPQHGTQGSLGNPNGTKAENPEESPKILTPDRVVVRVPKPLPDTIPDRPTPAAKITKKVTLGTTTEHPIPSRSPDGPTRNTRAQTRRRAIQNNTHIRVSGGPQARAELAGLECVQKRWAIRLSTTCRYESKTSWRPRTQGGPTTYTPMWSQPPQLFT